MCYINFQVMTFYNHMTRVLTMSIISLKCR